MLVDRKYEPCGDCEKLFGNKDLLIKQFSETNHTSNIFDEDQDVSLNEERLEREMIEAENTG